MKKTLKNYWWLVCIVSALVLAAGIIMLITNKAQIGEPGNPHINFVEIVSGFVILLLAVFFVYPAIKKHRGWYRSLFILEFFLVMAVVLLGFLVPAVIGFFGEERSFLPFDRSIDFWYGLVFYIHGFISLFAAAFSNLKNRTSANFAVGIILITLGCYFLFKGVNIEAIIGQTVAIVFTVLGALGLIAGIYGFTLFQKKVSK